MEVLRGGREDESDGQAQDVSGKDANQHLVVSPKMPNAKRCAWRRATGDRDSLKNREAVAAIGQNGAAICDLPQLLLGWQQTIDGG
jgi:hypothetical protein